MHVLAVLRSTEFYILLSAASIFLVQKKKKCTTDNTKITCKLLLYYRTQTWHITQLCRVPCPLRQHACWHVDLHPLCPNHYLKHLKLKFTIHTWNETARTPICKIGDLTPKENSAIYRQHSETVYSSKVTVHPYANGRPPLLPPDLGSPAPLSDTKQLTECWNSEICIK